MAEPLRTAPTSSRVPSAHDRRQHGIAALISLGVSAVIVDMGVMNAPYMTLITVNCRPVPAAGA
jgi:hypothetical protein